MSAETLQDNCVFTLLRRCCRPSKSTSVYVCFPASLEYHDNKEPFKMHNSKSQKLSEKRPNTSSNHQTPYLFSVRQALWNIVDSSLPDTVKLHVSSAVGGLSFWTQFEAHMTDCNNKRQFALCISGYRGNKRDSVGDLEEQYPLHVGKCKAKKVKAGKLRIK